MAAMSRQDSFSNLIDGLRKLKDWGEKSASLAKTIDDMTTARARETLILLCVNPVLAKVALRMLVGLASAPGARPDLLAGLEDAIEKTK